MIYLIKEKSLLYEVIFLYKFDKPVVAVCMSKIHEQMHKNLLYSLCKNAEKKGFYLHFFNVFTDLYNKDNNDLGEQSVFELIDYKSLSVLVILSETIKDELVLNNIIQKARSNNVPIISVDKKIDGCYNVLYDYYCIEKIITHVIEVHKCKKIAFMAGMRNNAFSDERISTFKSVLSEHGIPVREDWILYGDFWEYPARLACEEMLKNTDELPEAIICANDSMAIAVCTTLFEHGIRVPDDVIVTGFDGIELGKFYTPRITTANDDKIKTGEVITDIIKDILDGNPPENKNFNVEYEIVYSQSCGCEKIHSNNFNDHVEALYTELGEFKHNQTYMNQMVVHLTDGITLDEVPYAVKSYLSEREYDSISVCLNAKLFENSDLVSISHDAILKSDSMILMCQLIHGEYHVPFTEFNIKELLPNMGKIQSLNNQLLFMPLHCQQKVFGYFVASYEVDSINYQRLYELTINFEQALDTIINQTRLIAMNKRLNDLYCHDPLTGVLNRRGFYQEYTRLTKQISGDDEWLHVFSIDINRLKYINDTFGHNEGDYSIKTIARIAETCAGSGGICARFGGDEFVVAMFDKETGETSSSFIEYFRKMMKDFNDRHHKDYEVMASVGVCSAKYYDNINVDELMLSADKEMYVQKERSRRDNFRKSRRD